LLSPKREGEEGQTLTQLWVLGSAKGSEERAQESRQVKLALSEK
jgi:hypothetical protein